jgi:RES domain-containing protein
MSDLPARQLSRAVWHQTGPRLGLLDVSDPAVSDGRYHRVGGPGIWYASLTERGAWAELFRHWDHDEVSPFEVRRRIGRAQAEDLAVLDLTDPNVRAQLGVTEAEITDDDCSTCRDLADKAREAGLDGILAPSGALAGETTLVVFAHALLKLTAEHSRVQRPPIRMIDTLERIHLPEGAIDTVGRLYEALAALARRLGRTRRG